MPTVHNMVIEGHKLVALSFNPEASGTPVILFHGITGAASFWGPELLSTFLAHGPCYSLSLPGHYPAAFPPGFGRDQLTAALLARVLTAAIGRLVGEQPVTLVGYSTGGFAVLNIAAQTPALAQHVISIAGFAQGRWTGQLGLNQRLACGGPVGRALFKAFYLLPKVSPALLYQGLRIYVADADALYASPLFEPFMSRCYDDYKRLDLEAMLLYFSVMPDIDISHTLPRITAPTLVMAGDSDPIVPPSQSRLIAARVPRAELVLLPGAGHLPFMECPEAYGRALHDWLGKKVYNTA